MTSRGADPSTAPLAPSDFARVRSTTAELVAGLDPEDCVVQAMPDASPPKWHLAHTTWFFETFVLAAHVPGYRPFSPSFDVLFNSYYEAVGPRHPRALRGVLSRPTLREVMDYRAHVDEAVTRALPSLGERVASLVVLGLHHEQQHQELLVMDAKYNFAQNPLLPAFRAAPPARRAEAREVAPISFAAVEGGVVEIGHAGPDFAFDNEGPRHRRFIAPFAAAGRLVTNAEYADFVADGGYGRAELWLSDGIAWAREHRVAAPLYWRGEGASAREFTAYGDRPLDPTAPVCHVSAYEAAAYAEWAGARLLTEFEWEIAARSSDPGRASWLEDGRLHPIAAPRGGLFGELWAWTRSGYEPYPGYRPPRGAVGEYNGKFMANQWVLRGGCVATPRGHVRRTYRNFYYPHQRWPFTGIRLAKDIA